MLTSKLFRFPSRKLSQINVTGDQNSIGLLGMPNDLVLVRHGASEGNLAFAEEKKGNYDVFTPQFMETHESKWRLTRDGRNQAIAAGKWIKKNINIFFGAYFCSEYVRAIETATLLDLPHAHWTRHIFLRERNYGRMSSLSYAERLRRFEMQMRQAKRDIFYWRPPSGESLANLALRIDFILDKLSEKDYIPSSAIIVSHKNVMQVLRARIESVHQSQFVSRIMHVPKPKKIYNCSIIHYSRINPKTKEVSPVYRWIRMITPWIPELSNPPWEEIKYSYYSNKDLKELIQKWH